MPLKKNFLFVDSGGSLLLLGTVNMLKCILLQSKVRSLSVASYPDFSAAVEKSVGKAWKETSRDFCHCLHRETLI